MTRQQQARLAKQLDKLWNSELWAYIAKQLDETALGWVETLGDTEALSAEQVAYRRGAIRALLILKRLPRNLHATLTANLALDEPEKRDERSE